MTQDTIERKQSDNNTALLAEQAMHFVGRDVVIREFPHQARRGPITKVVVKGGHLTIGIDWQAIGGIVEGNPWRIFKDGYKNFGLRLADLKQPQFAQDGSITLTLENRLQLTILPQGTESLEKPAA